MTPRELVKRSLELRSPARIPRQLWLLPWVIDHRPKEVAEIQARFPDDIVTSPPFYKETPRTSGEEYVPGIFVDEWGCVFENRHKGVMGEVKEPLLKDWKDWETVRVPRERLSVEAERVDDFCRSTDRFALAKTGARPLSSFSSSESLRIYFSTSSTSRPSFSACSSGSTLFISRR